MKGVIFNITEKFITEEYGEDMLDEIMEVCTLRTKDPFVGPGTYHDEDMLEIIDKAAEKLQVSVQELLRRLGRYAFSKLVEAHPTFAEGYRHPKEFLLTVENIIHVEVKKLYEEAYTPTFMYQEPAPDRLIITYYSKRKLYAFMEGLIEGVADYFNQSIRQTHRVYELNGREVCDFDLTFQNGTASSENR